MTKCSGVILAGGQSRRMGQDKSLLTLGGKSLIQRVVDALTPLCDELVLVTNTPDRYAHGIGKTPHLQMVADVFPNTGSLGGLFSGLKAMSTDLGVAVACDMPFLNTELLRHLVNRAADADAVVPDLSESSTPSDDPPRALGGGGRTASPPAPLPSTSPRTSLHGEGRAKAKQLDLHPLHAVYRRVCLTPIEAQLRAGDLRMMGFFTNVNARYVRRDELMRLDPHLYSFFNVNTPDEWAQAEMIAAGKV